MGIYLIVCPLVFLAGFVDSIAGGGGLISLPAYMFAGIPVHNACLLYTSYHYQDRLAYAITWGYLIAIVVIGRFVPFKLWIF